MNEHSPPQYPQSGPAGGHPDLLEKQKTEWQHAVLAAQLLAVNPQGLRGIHMVAAPSPARTRWAETTLALLNPKKVHTVSHSFDIAHLHSRTDLLTTLAEGRTVKVDGLLDKLSGTVVLMPQASLLLPPLRRAMATALDNAVDFTALAIDEADDGEEGLSASLDDRLGLSVALSGQCLETWTASLDPPDIVKKARKTLKKVVISDRDMEFASILALQFGIYSMRMPYFTVQAARAHAALNGRRKLEKADFTAAVALTLLPRATRMPSSDQEEANEPEAPEEQQQQEAEENTQPIDLNPADIDQIVEAAQAMFAQDFDPIAKQQKMSRASQGRASRGVKNKRVKHGRPVGVRRGRRDEIRSLSMRDTLIAAIGKQSIRRPMLNNSVLDGHNRSGIRISLDDFRVLRRSSPQRVTTIFLVDASGSHAVGRLNEAKGATLSMLQTCYERRDRVAVISFGGYEANLSLAPTGAPARAAREMHLMPSGGGTPLAAGLKLAQKVAMQVRQDGDTPFVVLLTDGKANIALDGRPGRPEAAADVKAMAQTLFANGIESFFVDTGPRSSDLCKEIAGDLNARYLHLHRVPQEVLHQELKQAARGAGKQVNLT